jgi:hypothetical protein
MGRARALPRSFQVLARPAAALRPSKLRRPGNGFATHQHNARTAEPASLRELGRNPAGVPQSGVLIGMFESNPVAKHAVLVGYMKEISHCSRIGRITASFQ